jgi:hypothetical protein
MTLKNIIIIICSIIIYTIMFGIIRSGIKKIFGSKPSRRKFASIAYDQTRPDVVDGFKKIEEDEDQVAYKDDLGNVKIGIRGTSNLDDLKTDVNILAGKKLEDTDRYKKSEEFINRIKQKYKPSDISLSGHSLAGGVVNALSKKYGYKGKAYNPFLTDKSQISDKVENVRSAFDPVSALVAKDITTDYSKIQFNPLKAHSISQFD